MTKKTKSPESIESMMSEALLRSGYVLESRIINTLVQNGFFVEPNQRILDSTTGKDREIDLVAELWDSVHERTNSKIKVYVAVHFVCEVKNNPYPIVLLTELPFSPALEPWDSLHEGTNGFFKGVVPLDQSFFDYFTDEHKIYTQYCSFKLKKAKKDTEWMAWHPDDFHDDLEKIISYCRLQANQITGLSDDYHRLLLYLPVVILGGDLYVAKPQEATMVLTKVDTALHIHFGIHEGEQRLSLVVFVTERNCLTLFGKIVRFGQGLESMAAQKLASEDTQS